jgi:GNAT superfamily N-acetyltransferase
MLTQAPRPSAVIASRFAQGAVCIAAERANRLLGFLWLCPVQYAEDDVRCVFVLPQSAETWWDFDVWVQPDQRNGTVFAKLWQAAHDYLRQAGGRWTCSRLTRGNAGSIGAQGRLGATTIGHALFLWDGDGRLPSPDDPFFIYRAVRLKCRI